MKKWLAFFLSIISIGLYASPAKAACDLNTNVDLSECYYLNPATKTTVAGTFKTPTDLVNLIVRNLFVAAGILIFVMFMIGAFQFITGSAKGKEQALEIFKTTLIGFLVMFSAYWIIQIIELVTGTQIGI